MTYHLNPWFWATLLGTPEAWFALAVGGGLFYLGYRRHLQHRREVKAFLEVMIISLLVVFALVQVLKIATDLPRPCGPENPYCRDDPSFPSGHAATGFVFFTALFLYDRKSWPLFLVPVLVAFSRAALGVHTWADVLAGSLIGILLTLGVWRLLRLAWRRPPPRTARR
ncbi:MAG: phosphatase PAP2 family protein [Candidatus Aenigmarchaeota archaeon]|nr:phosphatase PAP2 family protein [Candidatus Aenigmarchaeota archaeon]